MNRNLLLACGGRGRIGDIIAVHSCKGGVGKSTVAVNLAFALSEIKKKKVGILDADVHGPSLPTLVGNETSKLQLSECGYYAKPVLSPHSPNIRCMSYGYLQQAIRQVQKGAGELVVRGLVASGIVRNMVEGVEWGDLDYLVVDMPPGTGDIPLELLKFVNFSGVVCVTTPQRVSAIDTRKGMEMFGKMKVPAAVIVKNMSYFDCEHGKRYFPFGNDMCDELKLCVEQGNKKLGYKNADTVSLPIEMNLSSSSDRGIPSVIADPASALSNHFVDIATMVEDRCNERRKKLDNKLPPLLKPSYDGAYELEHWATLLDCARVVFYE